MKLSEVLYQAEDKVFISTAYSWSIFGAVADIHVYLWFYELFLMVLLAFCLKNSIQDCL